MSTNNIVLHQESGVSAGLRDLKYRAKRGGRLIIPLLFLWTCGMGLYLYYSPPVYEEEVRFLVNNNRAPDVVSPEMNSGPVARDYVDEATVATEIQIMSSEDLLRMVVQRCGLAEGTDDAATELALRQLKKKLKVSPVLKANMIKASYSSSDPKQVGAVLSALADGYLNRHLKAHSSSGTFELFASQAKGYQDQLKALQDRLSNFHRSRNVVVLAEQKDLNLRKLIDLEASLNETDASRTANVKKMDSIRKELANLGSRITTQSRKVPNQYSQERLNTMLVEFRNRRTELLTKYQPGDRLVRQLDQQIEDTKHALAATGGQTATEETTDVNPLRQNLEAELSKAELNEAEYQSRRASLLDAIQSYRKGLKGLESDTADDDQLVRQIKEAEDNFFLYSKKREEARITEAMNQQKIANVALVQPPRVPTLPLPKPSVTFVASYALGCLLVFGVGLIKGTGTRRTVNLSRELEGLTGLPVLAAIPEDRALTVRGLHTVSLTELNS